MNNSRLSTLVHKNIGQRIESITNNRNKDKKIKKNVIENYLGAHKNFKTQFRNRNFKKVYEFLSKNQPQQHQYNILYLEDNLLAATRIFKDILINKDNKMYEDLEQQFIKTIFIFHQLYQMLIEDNIITQNISKVKIQLKKRFNRFINLILYFSNIVAIFYRSAGQSKLAMNFYSETYKSIVLPIIKSFTSNYKLLCKTTQFIISYASFCIQNKYITYALQLLHQGLNNQINQFFLLHCQIKFYNKMSKIRRRKNQCYNQTITIFINLALCYELQSNTKLIYLCLMEAYMIEKATNPQIRQKNIVFDMLKQYDYYHSSMIEIKRIAQVYFKEENLKKEIKQSYPINKLVLKGNPVITEGQKLEQDQISNISSQSQIKNNFIKYTKIRNNQQIFLEQKKKTYFNNSVKSNNCFLTEKVFNGKTKLNKKNFSQHYRNIYRKPAHNKPQEYQEIIKEVQQLKKIDEIHTNTLKIKLYKLRGKRNSTMLKVLNNNFNDNKELVRRSISMQSPIALSMKTKTLNQVPKKNEEKGIQLFKKIILSHKKQFGLSKYDFFIPIQKDKQKINQINQKVNSDLLMNLNRESLYLSAKRSLGTLLQDYKTNIKGNYCDENNKKLQQVNNIQKSIYN